MLAFVEAATDVQDITAYPFVEELLPSYARELIQVSSVLSGDYSSDVE
jgi:hypothetical protein